MNHVFLIAAALAALTSTSAIAEVVCNSKSDYTNVRNGPGARDYEVVTRVQNGDKIRVLGSVVSASGHRWMKVEAPGIQDDVIGYIDSLAVSSSCGNYPDSTKPNPGYDKCFYVMASRQTMSDVDKFIASIMRNPNSTNEIDDYDWSVAKAQNGWFAITIGSVENDAFESLKSRYVGLGISPNDAYCSNGAKYLSWVDHDTKGSLPADSRVADVKAMLEDSFNESKSDDVQEFLRLWNYEIVVPISFGDEKILEEYEFTTVTNNPKGRDMCLLNHTLRESVIGRVGVGRTTSYEINFTELYRGLEGGAFMNISENLIVFNSTEGYKNTRCEDPEGSCPDRPGFWHKGDAAYESRKSAALSLLVSCGVFN